MDVADGVRLREDQEVVVAAHLAIPSVEPRPAIAPYVELELLDHGAHSPIEHQDALGGDAAQISFGGKSRPSLRLRLHNTLMQAPSPRRGEGWGEGARAVVVSV